MSEIAFLEVRDTIKRILKNQGVTYKELGFRINMSEAGIKRLFTAKDLSMKRIFQICTVINISINDLFEESHYNDHSLVQISEENLKFFRNHPDYFLFFCMVAVEKLSLKTIQEQNKISRKTVMKFISRLEKMKLLEYISDDNIKVRIPKNFTFASNDFIQGMKGKMSKHLLNSFLRSESEDIDLNISHLRMRKSTYSEFTTEFRKLLKEFGTRSVREVRICHPNEIQNFSVLFGSGPVNLTPPISFKDVAIERT